MAAASEKEEAARATLAELQLKLPSVEADYRVTADQMQASTHALLTANQRIQIDTNNVQHLNQSILESELQIKRFEEALSQLEMPDTKGVEVAQQALAEAETMVVNTEQAIQKLRSNEELLQANINTLRELQLQVQRVLSQAEAEVNSLEKIQQSLNSEGELSDWLSRQGLQNNARLWEKINIDDAWSLALEAVLGARLNALLAKSKIDDRPPGALVLSFSRRSSKAALISVPSNSTLTPLISMVNDCGPAFQATLNDWLAGIYLLNDGEDGSSASEDLVLGERLVNK